MNEDFVLKLCKNIYSLKQGGYDFYTKLRAFLTSIGFTQSDFDPCIFIKDHMIALSYVDDCLMFAQNNKLMQYFTSSLAKEFKLGDEVQVPNYLGA